MSTKDRIWITWERQRRNRTLSAALDARLFEIDVRASRVKRYLLCIYRTLRVLVDEKPSLVFVQNPSIVLSLLAMTWCRLIRIPLVMDAHNAGVYPFEGKRPWANSIAKFLFRMVNLTLVTNDSLATYVHGSGGRAFVLPDPLPIFGAPMPRTTRPSRPCVLFICTWAADEPFLEVIEAARHLDNSITLYITGNSGGRENSGRMPLPENVVLTGYLSDTDYEVLLRSCNLVIDLTTRQDCLVCGAYEALAAEKPLIVSDTRALRIYFDRGTQYTNNQALDLADKIKLALSREMDMASEMKAMKAIKIQEWSFQHNNLERQLQRLVVSKHANE